MLVRISDNNAALMHLLVGQGVEETGRQQQHQVQGREGEVGH